MTSPPQGIAAMQSHQKATAVTNSVTNAPAHNCIANAVIAQQRAHDAMMIARELKSDVRRRNMKMQRMFISDRFMGHQDSERSQPAKAIQKTFVPDISSTQLELSKDMDIVSLSMAWIADVFHLGNDY